MADSNLAGYEAALLGDFSSGGASREETLLLQSMAYAAGIAPAPLETDAVAPTAHVASSLTCLQQVRAHIVTFDSNKASEWLNLHRRCHDPRSARSQTALGLSECWLRLRGGASPALDEELARLERAAREGGFAEMVLEAASLRALAMTETDRDEATRIARRASRMSRTEAMPQLEYLANVTLATVRRLNGEPHLAARIVTALRRVAPPLWHGWLGWESMLAGVAPEGAEPVSRELGAWFRARQQGDRSRDAVIAALAAELPAPVRHFELVRTALTLDAETDNDWLRGVVDDIPGELCGIARVRGPSPEGETALAYAFADVAGRARRFLPLGFTSFPAGTHVLPQGRRKQARMASLISTLALSRRQAIPVEKVFSRVYGFEYAAEIHHGVFNVLIHRARKYAESVGEIERSEEGLWLELKNPVVVPDPRCVALEHDRILQAIAARAGPLTARDASNAAGVSLRVAQIALKDLVEDGFCRLEKSGRESRYVVEDTTFREPTQHR